jgi:predicted metal-dependent enzyme (double-stranded beta helix superfamily)
MAPPNAGPAASHPAATSHRHPVGRSAGPASPLPRRQVNLLAIADGFAQSAATIPQLQEPTQRSWVLLAVTDLFEAWAIGWPAGGTIELHDHGRSNGAIVVAAGSLTETTVRTTAQGLTSIATRRISAGEHRRFGSHYIHDLANDGKKGAVSVHVYGPRLATMTYYRLGPDGLLTAVRTEEPDPIGPFDTTSEHDPS